METSAKEAEILILDRDPGRSARLAVALSRVEPRLALRSMDPELGALSGDALALGAVVILDAADEPRQVVLARVRRVRQSHPSARVIVRGVRDEEVEPLAYLEAGAWGYALQAESEEDIARRVVSIAEGDSPLSPAIGGLLIRRLHEMARCQGPLAWAAVGPAPLTPREQEVLSLIARRMTNREIAEELVLEVGTVKNHVHSLLKKLQVDTRQRAAEVGLQSAAVGEASADDQA